MVERYLLAPSALTTQPCPRSYWVWAQLTLQPTFVYLGNEVLAWQQKFGSVETIAWEHRDLSNASVRMVGAADGSEAAELDPLGSNAGMSAPELPPGHEQYPIEYEPTYPGFGNVLSDECRIDGIRSPCDLAVRYLGSGAASLDPDSSRLGPGGTINLPGLGQGVWVPDNRPDGGSVDLRGTQDSTVTIIGNMSGHFAFTGGGATIGSTLSLRQPQNTLPLPSNLRDRVSDVINNPKTDCAEFIKRLLGAAAARNGKAFSDNAMDLFDRVQREAGFQLKQLESDHGGEADFEGSKRVVYIAPRSSSDDSRVLEHTNNGYAVTVVNELMHQARNGGLYDDRTLGRAIFNLLDPQQQKDHPFPKSSDVSTNSKYFHSLFKLHCRSTTGE